MERYETERLCWEIHELMARNEVEMAKRVLGVELGLAYQEGKEARK